MTRRMEHLFLKSPAHFGVAYALRRAELLGLGAEPAFTNVILTARAALDLDHGNFWRTAWRFLIANAGAIDRAQVAPMIDFLHGIRHERIEVETPAGMELRDPPDPGFSLEGRTVASVLRLMEAWHRGLGLGASRREWAPSGLRPMTVEIPTDDPDAPPTRWELVELTSAALLRAEGAALKHCVASYGRRCVTGDSRIWSLRRRREGDATPVLTIEVDPRRKVVVQVRGRYNRAPIGRSWQLVQTWASRASAARTMKGGHRRGRLSRSTREPPYGYFRLARKNASSAGQACSDAFMLAPSWPLCWRRKPCPAPS